MRRHLPLLLAVVLVPLAASLGQRPLESLVAPAVACTGAPTFEPGAMTILPADGATVPRNMRVLFFRNIASPSMFGMRPIEPAEVRTQGEAIALTDRSSDGLGLPRLEASTTYELWLPDGLPPPWGKQPPQLARARTFTTSSEDDTTPPRIRLVGTPIHHPAGQTSCGPFARLELPVDVEDVSPTFIEVDAFTDGRGEERARMVQRAPVVSGRIFIPDPTSTQLTHLVLTPIDIAGNRGPARTLDLPALGDGGAEPASSPLPASPSDTSSRRIGCGKY